MICKDDKERKLLQRIKYQIKKELDNEFYSKLYLIVDSREQENKHIIRKIQKHNLSYSVNALSFGDYSFYYDGVDYTHEFSIERKNSVNELISSLLSKRFEREIKRGTRTKDYFFETVIEEGSMLDIYSGNHDINVNADKIIPMIHSRKAEYNIGFTFINRHYMFNHILYTIKYYLRYRLIKDELKIKHNIDYNESIYF